LGGASGLLFGDQKTKTCPSPSTGASADGRTFTSHGVPSAIVKPEQGVPGRPFSACPPTPGSGQGRYSGVDPGILKGASNSQFGLVQPGVPPPGARTIVATCSKTTDTQKCKQLRERGTTGRQPRATGPVATLCMLTQALAVVSLEPRSFGRLMRHIPMCGLDPSSFVL
jgi:hypothetical protein